MGIQKNFIVKNGLEVNNNLIFADTNSNKVGIATTIVSYTLDVDGGIGANDLIISGVSTLSNLNLTNLSLSGHISVAGTTGKDSQVLVSTGTGVTWANTSKVSSVFTASVGQTSFTFSYQVGSVEVYVNGVRLSPNEFDASDGSNVILNDACFGDETVEILGIVFSPSITDTWTNASGGNIYRLSNVGIGTTNPTYKLDVIGDARITGILTVGTASITLDGVNNNLYVGSGVSIYGDSGEVFVLGEKLQGITTNTSINTSGIITASYFYGDGSGLTNVPISGIATYATSSGISTYATSSGIATYASTAGISTSVIGGIGSITSLSVSGISTLGIVQISSGIITATSGIVTYYGDGSKLSGIVAGSSSQWVTTSAGIHTLSNVGVGTTNPQVNLSVLGGSRFGGVFERVSTATTYLSDSAVVLELDCQQSTTYTYTIPTATNIGIVSFKNMLTPTGSANGTTVTVLFTQNTAGTGNTTAATGIGTNITVVGYENGASVAGISTRAFVGSGTTVTLSTTGSDTDFVSFYVYYNGGTNTSVGSYIVFATRNGSFR